MTYTHITNGELVMLEACFHQMVRISKIATFINRSRQTIHKFVTFLRKVYTAIDYFK